MGSGHPWTEPKRLKLTNKFNVYKGQTFSIELFTKVKWQNGEFWKFVSDGEEEPTNLMNPATGYRCRLVVMPAMEEEKEHYCYFYAFVSDPSKPPQIIGEHLFGHAQSWEGGSEKAEDAEMLFTHS